MLDVVFGEIGIIEPENKNELSKNLEIACTVLDAYEKNMQGNDSKKPSAYLKEREKTVLRRLIAVIEEKSEKRMPKYLHPYTVISQNQLIHFLSQKKACTRLQ